MVFLGVLLPLGALALRARPEPFGLSLLAYAGLSLAWATIMPDALMGMLWVLLVVSGLSLGRELELDAVMFWFTLGLLPNVGIAWLQWLDGAESPILDYLINVSKIFQGNMSQPSGLFVNKNFLGEVLVLVVLWTAWRRRYIMLLCCLPGLWLAQSKEAVLAFGAGLLAWALPRSWPLVAAPVGLALAAYNPSSLEVRLGLWGGALQGVSLWGHGIGQFYTALPLYVSDTLLYRDHHAHNDLIELWFELGAFGLMWGALLATTAYLKSAGLSRVLLVALGIQSLVAFPLYVPTTLFLWIILVGGILGNRSLERRARPAGQPAPQQGPLARRPADA